MAEITLTKRYPESRTEDVADAFTRGFIAGMESRSGEISDLHDVCRELWDALNAVLFKPGEISFELLKRLHEDMDALGIGDEA